MDAITDAWVKKAEADLQTAAREFGTTVEPNYEAVCFHSHQCAERYLKARLQAGEVPFPNTNHLVVLLHLCLDLEPAWEGFRDHLRTLNSHADQSADPEWIPDEAMAQQAFELCCAFRDQVRKDMGL